MKIFKSVYFLSLRTIAFGLGYALTSLIFLLLGSHDFLIKASPWWPVYGLFANLLCFIIIRRALKDENVKISSLINFQSQKIKKDIMFSLAFITLSIIIAITSSFIFGYLIFGRYPYDLMPLFSDIPIVVVIIFVVIFPVINSILEEITYNGFIFPRLEAEVKNTNIVILIVLCFFTLQHIFIMFVPDLKYLTWRLLCFIPLLAFWIIIYKKMRRLTSLIIVHWFMDSFAIMSIILAPGAR
jgi:membrane protease YdiL (CAAX protease family)